ncbi:MAG: class 1 fructose-bisphosphatase [Ignavibacteriota bacterium]|nr:MAG: class 1 fructose-bisphosphatase [Chlorobiota bacterium]MBE7477185.1 class 1 fructose-bisphosphatase [Ignavibacteriales bacterium]MBL1122569.1 class 1 fructose-bisphosphatase [Ignavibacteriota bacterium]MCC7093005.1 class 1 fructose-bisphosphatase [Ignavibacteriaceae bacterium]MCE7856728.1 class 1 fructose-bisphosphatase [Ignavibacteria bacterium CHB3]MEB2296080.1 class 1 fructose-bisphosphatase [Ignavibacteria bacterium]
MPTTQFMTLSRYIIEEQTKHTEATGELSKLLHDLSLAAKVISLEVNKAGLVDIIGYTGDKNVHGEKVKKLDILAHEMMIKAMDHGGNLCVMASEEEEEIIHIPDKFHIGKYVLLFDPLDGSSNIDVNISVGTIFSIYKRISPGDGPGTMKDCLQQGINQIAAGYVIYGSSTMLVYTAGNGVHGFTLDPAFGEFLLSHPNMQTPKKSKIYSINEGNYLYWHPGLKRYIKYLQEEDKMSNRPFSSRYTGSMVADVHRNLIYGGIFMYPSDSRNPNGKLRLMYECNPMAFIVEQAGGRATNGKQRIMEITPEKLHQRVPIFIGSEDDVRMVEKFMAEVEVTVS